MFIAFFHRANSKSWEYAFANASPGFPVRTYMRMAVRAFCGFYIAAYEIGIIFNASNVSAGCGDGI